MRWPFADNDRARAERATEGLVKVVVGRGGRVLGAAIVGAHAGELILPWVLAVERGLKLSALASLVAPYPTLSEVSKRAAGAYYAPRLFSAAHAGWCGCCGGSDDGRLAPLAAAGGAGGRWGSPSTPRACIAS